MIMKTTIETRQKIEEFEGLMLKAYKDPAGIWTIGYGHTLNVKEGDTITKEKADELFAEDLTKFENIVMTYDYIYTWTQNQFDALVSFAYNIGNIDQLTNYGTRTIAEIELAIPKYCKAGNEVLPGLKIRRAWELEKFRSKESADTSIVNGSAEDFITALANRVIAGEFGNGSARKQALGEYIYNLVQDKVNEIYNIK